MVHYDARDTPTDRPDADQAILKEVVTEMKRRCDIVICTATEGRPGDTVENSGKKFI